MSIETQPTILRFQDGSSDKLWVMCPDQNGENWVYWGATRWDGSESATLHGKAVSGTPFDRIYDKERKGYQQWHGVSFDLDTRRVSTRVLDDKIRPTEPQSKTLSNASFWYRIDPAVPTADISSFLDEICHGLKNYEIESDTSGFVDQFNALSLTAALRAGEHSGTSEYSESPMAAILLHSIRRAYRSLVLVSDDDNEMMPDRLDDLYDLLCNEHLFGKMPDHWMPPAFKEIAIAMLCIDRPVNLANLTTEKPAAFF
jgi:hypothetical protein|tara:strand:- start:10735 stop:11505 length:771 start_codon:yes stop_codon:yes gene_type:complete